MTDLTTGEVVALLSGAAVGALVTGLLSVLRDVLAEHRVSKAARRVIEGEVKDAIDLSCMILDEGRWPIAVRPLWNESWVTYRDAVARTVTPEEFAQLEASYRHLNQLEHVLSDTSKWDQPLAEPNDTEFGPDRTFLLRGTASCPAIDKDTRRRAVGPEPKNATTGSLDRALRIFQSRTA